MIHNQQNVVVELEENEYIGVNLLGCSLKKVRRILSRLHRAKEIKDMNAPGLGLHPLKGDLKGHWGVTVKNNWRIVFIWNQGNAL